MYSPAVLTAETAARGHENGLLEFRLVEPAVVDGDFGGRAGIQTAQQFGVGEEHEFLILPAGGKVVYVGELIARLLAMEIEMAYILIG